MRFQDPTRCTRINSFHKEITDIVYTKTRLLLNFTYASSYLFLAVFIYA